MKRPALEPVWVAFDRWWWERVVFAFHGDQITRRDLVLSVAEKDGGVNVDRGLGRTYFALSRLNALGWRCTKDGVGLYIPINPDQPAPLPEGYTGYGEVQGPIAATLREISHEVVTSLFAHLGSLLVGLSHESRARVSDPQRPKDTDLATPDHGM